MDCWASSDMLIDADMDLLEQPILTRPQALGKWARLQAPYLWQVAAWCAMDLENVEMAFSIWQSRSSNHENHCCFSSSNVVVYKRGSIETLYQYYPELRNPDFTTAITIGHARYSTNTATSFERVQPFSLLGHNGEINTIARLREQAQMLGVELVEGASDSQDLDRLLATLIHRYHFSLAEAMELAFPPIFSEVENFLPNYKLSINILARRLGRLLKAPLASFRATVTSAYLAWMHLDCGRCGLEIRKRNISSPRKKASTIWMICSLTRFRSRRVKRCVCVSIADTHRGSVRLSCHPAKDAQPDAAQVWVS
jgi:hypothetical protein